LVARGPISFLDAPHGGDFTSVSLHTIVHIQSPQYILWLYRKYNIFHKSIH